MIGTRPCRNACLASRGCAPTNRPPTKPPPQTGDHHRAPRRPHPQLRTAAASAPKCEPPTRRRHKLSPPAKLVHRDCLLRPRPMSSSSSRARLHILEERSSTSQPSLEGRGELWYIREQTRVLSFELFAPGWRWGRWAAATLLLLGHQGQNRGRKPGGAEWRGVQQACHAAIWLAWQAAAVSKIHCALLRGCPLLAPSTAAN
jgi:hypothetical protein